MRNIFIDPESLCIEDEFMQKFVFHGGIPVATISQVDNIAKK